MTTPAGAATPPPAGPYSPIVQAGDWLVTAGQLGVTPDGEMADGIEAQTAQCMANIRTLLESKGYDVVLKPSEVCEPVGQVLGSLPPALRILGVHPVGQTTCAVLARASSLAGFRLALGSCEI